MKTGNSYIINFDDEIEAVYLEWLHPPDIQAFVAAHQEGLRLLRDGRSVVRWLENRQQLHELASDCHIWARDQWFPKALKAGIRYIAIVLSELPLSSVSIEQISEILELDVVTDYFDEIEDARKWLHHPDYD